MALPKNPKADLKRKYTRTLEFSFIFSIVFLIIAFKFFPDPQIAEFKSESPPEIIKGADIIQTKQDAAPPPPPKPLIPIEAPDDEILIDVPIDETTLDPNADVPLPQLPKGDDETTAEINTPYVVVEQMPEPIGGVKSILERLHYPELARRAGIEGKVVVKALVDKDGNVEKVEILKGIGMGCDDEAMRVIKETKFQPGKQRGRAVRVYVNIPVRFELK